MITNGFGGHILNRSSAAALAGAVILALTFTQSVAADAAEPTEAPIDKAVAIAETRGLTPALGVGTTPGAKTEWQRSKLGVESVTITGPGGWVRISEPGASDSDTSRSGIKAAKAAVRVGSDDARVAVRVDSQSEASEGLAFEVGMPAGAEMVAGEAGALDVVLPGREVVRGGVSSTPLYVLATISPGWALDAAGRSLRSWYEVRGSTLVQRIETTGTTMYPLVADPYVSSSFSWGKWSHVVSRDVTNRVARYGALQLTALAFFSGPAVPYYLAMSAVVVNAAVNALDQGICLEMHALATPTNFVWADTYRGSRCRDR